MSANRHVAVFDTRPPRGKSARLAKTTISIIARADNWQLNATRNETQSRLGFLETRSWIERASSSTRIRLARRLKVCHVDHALAPSSSLSLSLSFSHFVPLSLRNFTTFFAPFPFFLPSSSAKCFQLYSLRYLYSKYYSRIFKCNGKMRYLFNAQFLYIYID